MSLFSPGNKKANKKRPVYIDIHSHVSFSEYEHDRGQVIEQMRYANTKAITVGVDLETSKKAVEIANGYAEIYACVGLHPADNKTEIFNADDYRDLARNVDTVAIGECGLDYFRIDPKDKKEKERQKKNFEAQIKFAIEEKLPLMLHIRPKKGDMDAYKDALEILEKYKKEYGDGLWGNVHFFVGDIEIAKHFIRLNFSLSFTGVITFTHDYDDIIKEVPLQMILSETDSPYVTPVPFRGERNEPIHVKAVVKRIAQLRMLDFEEVRQVLVDNAYRVFKLGK